MLRGAERDLQGMRGTLLIRPLSLARVVMVRMSMCGLSRDSWYFAAGERLGRPMGMLALARSTSGTSGSGGSGGSMTDEHGVL